MEVALNLAWLAALLTSFLVWGCRTLVSSEMLRRTWKREAFSLVSAFLMLFPIVSLSDDLLAGTQVLEENTSTWQGSGKNFSNNSRLIHTVSHGFDLAWAKPFIGCSSSETVIWRYVIDIKSPPCFVFQSAQKLRAPPISS